MTRSDLSWAERFRLDIQFGYINAERGGGGHYTPRLVLNGAGTTVEHALLEELRRCQEFVFSVAFISPDAIAQLKQHLLEFTGTGCIVTSDFLGFNSPRAFAELLALREFAGISVRRSKAEGFHPKGYVFRRHESVTAMIGSANLTTNALSRNQEWNLKVSAAPESDLAQQIDRLLLDQLSSSEPLSETWVAEYATTYVAPSKTIKASVRKGSTATGDDVTPNEMQQAALAALREVRAQGAKRALIISATGTGKTMLSAFDVRAFNPRKLLFVAHREQILDRTIAEYQRVLQVPPGECGKLTGAQKEQDRRFVFATIQTLSQKSVLEDFAWDAFDYIIVDEAHRSAAESYQRVLGHLRPAFLLGMTATPERPDRFNVFELFDHNVPYEIRLNEALSAKMLCPFHYYGITDVSYEDGTTTTDSTPLARLVTPERVGHVISALDRYAQAGVAPRGLIFCSRKDEALALSDSLNQREFRGRRLRTMSLTGDDPPAFREECVSRLEAGELDYLLTVDIFNEGIDIPSINQVVMMRQTQSPIVFVQQLGRGLRLCESKDYLVVIDLIGNYTNNYLIPIALFGDETLNKESLRERLNETIEAGALPGSSSVSFDEISRERILRSIAQTKLDSLSNLKTALLAMRHRVGRVPALADFWRFDSVDPLLLATKRAHYPDLVQTLLGHDAGLSDAQSRTLSLISHEAFAAKRAHELILLGALVREGSVDLSEFKLTLAAGGYLVDPASVRGTLHTFLLEGYPSSAKARYREPIIEVEDDVIRLKSEPSQWLQASKPFADAVEDLLETGLALTNARYDRGRYFTPGMQYTRAEAAQILGWSRATASTIYGVKVDVALGVCAIFVTLEKSESVTASTAYRDELIDQATMRWFSKSNRTIHSSDVAPIVHNQVSAHVFVKKDDAEGQLHYYLGRATAHEATQTEMSGRPGETIPVVAMLLRFDEPISQGLFDYFGSGT